MTNDWRRAARLAAVAAAPLAAALALSACSTGNTYGTGTSPGMQTLQDLTGIAMISGAKKAPIDYEPRPDLVVPPSTAALPPPGSDSDTANAANWPVDPDANAAKSKTTAEAVAASGQAPTQYVIPNIPRGTSTLDRNSQDLTPDQVAAVRKQFAAANGKLSVDANGNPVRKYLTDPPVDYRQPDPTEPLTADATQKKRKKFLWWYVDE